MRSLQLVKRCLPGSWTQMQVAYGQHFLAAQPKPQLCSLFTSSCCSIRHADLACSSTTTSSSSSSRAAGLQPHGAGLLFQAACRWREPFQGAKQQATVGFVRHSSSASDRQAKHMDAMMKQMAQFEFNSPTLGDIGEMYKRPVSLMQADLLLNPIKLARLLFNRTMGSIRNEAFIQKAKSCIAGFNIKEVTEVAADLCKKISKAQADYRLLDIKDMVDETLWTRMKAEAEERRMRRWDKIDLEIVEEEGKPFSSNMALVQARGVSSSKTSPILWVQLTYRIRSQQRFAAYRIDTDQKGRHQQQKLVFGHPDELIDVEDHWVFEYKARLPSQNRQQEWPGARWRLVSRLTV
eukprot:GHUV01024018.1.p1 GENE.GHUV01024018.1~~GHUV01024018.1.p1  ORF type:complete len:350 (+),score=70.73 GHUV01024018.1:256-1305(+)